MSGEPVKHSIQQKLEAGMALEYLELLNESHKHSVPPNSETHFKVVAVTADFEGLRAVARHQKVYGLLREELAGPVHALALHTYTPDEWAEQSEAPSSPDCKGGSKSS